MRLKRYCHCGCRGHSAFCNRLYLAIFTEDKKEGKKEENKIATKKRKKEDEQKKVEIACKRKRISAVVFFPLNKNIRDRLLTSIPRNNFEK